uniref:Uncharacterized protein n=1 Tax=Anguilla anguilla TaxID=7936 RepID=A0A0E9XV70_ANGAN
MFVAGVAGHHISKAQVEMQCVNSGGVLSICAVEAAAVFSFAICKFPLDSASGPGLHQAPAVHPCDFCNTA